MSDSNCCFGAIGIVLGIGILLTIILVPLSFEGLEYYEMGFKRQKSTGKVDKDEVYTGGKHFIGPDYEFKTYKASAHFLDLVDIDVFTEGGNPIDIDVYFQYFLREKDLPILHEKYDINYESVVRKYAIAELKAVTPKFNINQFYNDRPNVEKALFRAIRDRLGGPCCRSSCRGLMACPEGCVIRSKCNSRKDGGLWVDVKYFQMGPVSIDYHLEERRLRSLTERENNKQEELKQESQVIRKATNAIVQNIENEAKEIRQKAQSESQLIRTVSQANYTVTVEKARTEGLKSLYTRLNINDQSVKNSFDYLRTLRGLDHVHLTVDFQQRIVGGLG